MNSASNSFVCIKEVYNHFKESDFADRFAEIECGYGTGKYVTESNSLPRCEMYLKNAQCEKFCVFAVYSGSNYMSGQFQFYGTIATDKNYEKKYMNFTTMDLLKTYFMSMFDSMDVPNSNADSFKDPKVKNLPSIKTVLRRMQQKRLALEWAHRQPQIKEQRTKRLQRSRRMSWRRKKALTNTHFLIDAPLTHTFKTRTYFKNF